MLPGECCRVLAKSSTRSTSRARSITRSTSRAFAHAEHFPRAQSRALPDAQELAHAKRTTTQNPSNATQVWLVHHRGCGGGFGERADRYPLGQCQPAQDQGSRYVKARRAPRHASPTRIASLTLPQRQRATSSHSGTRSGTAVCSRGRASWLTDGLEMAMGCSASMTFSPSTRSTMGWPWPTSTGRWGQGRRSCGASSHPCRAG